MRYNKNQKVPGSNPTRRSAEVRNPTTKKKYLNFTQFPGVEKVPFYKITKSPRYEITWNYGIVCSEPS